MGKRYEQHDDLCGCDRCAHQWDTESPQPVFDVVEDPTYCEYCSEPPDYCRCWEDAGSD
jgi:hypothetical protein